MNEWMSFQNKKNKAMAEGAATVQFAYPRDLARYVIAVWPKTSDSKACQDAEDAGLIDPLPELALLEKLLSACYQASLLHDEGRALSFRLLLRSPGRLDPDGGPPFGLHRLQFSIPRPYTPSELRRLAPAAAFPRSLIAVEPDEEDGYHIWGVVQSGPRWMQERYGGRRPSCPLPGSLIVLVTGPGALTISAGSLVVARLEGGRVLGPPTDIYSSVWLKGMFTREREEVHQLHAEARHAAVSAGSAWGPVDPVLVGLITQQMVKRLVATIRDSHHGGLLIVLSPETIEEIERRDRTGEPSSVRIKYGFEPGEPRSRFRTLLLSLLAVLAEDHQGRMEDDERGLIGWTDFQDSVLRDLASHDEAILEVAYQAAGFAAADGAVVMNKRFELIGFGGEISSELPLVPTVAHALDVEGSETIEVATDLVGTRHRAAYRLINEFRDALAVVVSQDGEVRFVAWKNNKVTYWTQ